MQEVSGGFIVKKNKLLFGKRSKKKKWAPDTWDIAGGRALANETPLETLKREIKEETGITVLHARLLATIDMHGKNDSDVFKYHIYMITAWKGRAYNASGEHTKIRWFTRAQLVNRKMAMPQYLQLIDEWFKES